MTPRATVVLDGTASHDTNSPLLPLTYTWTQVPNGAQAIVLQPVAGHPEYAMFSAPALDPVTQVTQTFQFKVTVSNGYLTNSAIVTVKDAALQIPADTLTGVTAVFQFRRSRLTVNATSSDPKAVLTLQGFGPMGPGIPALPGATVALGARTMIIVGVNPPPDTVTIISSSGGVITVPVTFK